MRTRVFCSLSVFGVHCNPDFLHPYFQPWIQIADHHGCKMPKLAKPLTDTQVKNAKPQDKLYTLADGGGMYLEVAPTGSRIWRMAYRQPNGKNTRLTFGAYPEISLLEARAKRSVARKQIADGIDPSQFKRTEKHAKIVAASHTFEGVARTWLEKNAPLRETATVHVPYTASNFSTGSAYY